MENEENSTMYKNLTLTKERRKNHENSEVEIAIVINRARANTEKYQLWMR